MKCCLKQKLATKYRPISKEGFIRRMAYEYWVIMRCCLRGNKAFIVRCLIVNFNCHSVSTVLQHKVGVAAVLIDIIEMILRIEVSGLLCTKGFTKQLYK